MLNTSMSFLQRDTSKQYIMYLSAFFFVYNSNPWHFRPLSRSADNGWKIRQPKLPSANTKYTYHNIAQKGSNGPTGCFKGEQKASGDEVVFTKGKQKLI